MYSQDFIPQSVAKFRVDSVQITGQSVWDKEKKEMVSKNGATVILHPVTGGSEENEQFFDSTPGGEIRLDIVNLDAAKVFVPYKNVYVGFAAAP